MRPRTEAAIALGVVAALLVLAFATGRRVRAVDDPDPRASSFVAGREGVRALADAADRLGIEVVRWRERPQGMGRQMHRDSGATVAVLAPSRAISSAERSALVHLAIDSAGADLVLAGQAASGVMRCFGYRVRRTVFDSSRAAPSRAAGRVVPPGAAAWVHETLVPRSESPRAPQGAAPPSDPEDACPPVIVLAADTLLLAGQAGVAMLQLTIAPHGRRVTLVGDADLVRNRVLRTAEVAALVTDAVLPRRGRLVFDEYHQGFGPGGSMARATVEWSLRHPVGWMVWQLAAVGVLALLAGGVRFGPVRAAIPRQRRSTLEHVRALATALAAARGHREAVGAMVRGLRRRLAPAARAPASRDDRAPASRDDRAPASRDDWRAWLESLATTAPNVNTREAAGRLARLADTPEPATAVLSAANAVEDVWHSLRP